MSAREHFLHNCCRLNHRPFRTLAQEHVVEVGESIGAIGELLHRRRLRKHSRHERMNNTISIKRRRRVSNQPEAPVTPTTTFQKQQLMC
jgi:hypothetical protein